MTIIPIRRPPTWPLRLSNAELVDEFSRALDARGPGELPAALMLRIDILYDEISRREHIGTMSDDDWMEGA
jgi:hypothetical protein